MNPTIGKIKANCVIESQVNLNLERFAKDFRSHLNNQDSDFEPESNINKENIPATCFPFNMIQIPFQIMRNWPFKFRNNKQDNPAHFLELERFKIGYRLNDRDVLENFDALLLDQAKDWRSINKTSWRILSDFFEDFKNTYTYIDERFSQEIRQKLKFCNQNRT